MPEPSRKSIVLRALIVAGALALAVGGIVLCEHRPVAATRLIECLLVFGLVIVLAWATRGALRNAMVVGCSLMFGLAVVEGVTLAMSRGGTNRAGTVADDSGLAQSQPLFGWGPSRPGVFHSTKHTADGRVIFDTHVTIDETLNRKTEPSMGPRPIAFFGDSWVYGDGVDDDGALPQAFADLTDRKIPVLNLAFAGWSPAQNLLALQSGLYAPLLRSPRHFILFTAAFHLERTACKGLYATSHAPRFVLKGSTLKYTGSCKDGWNLLAPIERFARGFSLGREIDPLLAQPTRHDVETYIKLIEAFVATAKQEYGVRTTILFAPFGESYIKGSGYTEAQLLEALRKSGVDVLVDELPPIEDPSLYSISGDGHPSKLANQARAREVKAHLAQTDPNALAMDDEEAGR